MHPVRVHERRLRAAQRLPLDDRQGQADLNHSGSAI